MLPIWSRKDSVNLNIGNLRYLHEIYHTNATIGACVNVLSHYLLPETHINMEISGKVLELDEVEADKWDSFAAEVFAQIV